MDDFIARMEIALHAYGFQDSNTIACSNLCRDEVTFILKQKLDAVRLLSFASTLPLSTQGPQKMQLFRSYSCKFTSSEV